MRAFTDLSASEREAAVAAFNARYGEMDRALWCLSQNSRPFLVDGGDPSVTETLIWTVKSWWGVQGVRTETREMMAQALGAMQWSSEDFEELRELPRDAEGYATEVVTTLVERSQSLGVPRREFSLASKVLHWLLPWRVPAMTAS